MKLLRLDSSITGDTSVSRILTQAIVARFADLVDDIEIETRDLAANPVPHQSEALLLALAGVGNSSPEVSLEVADAQWALESFLAADIVVIGAPMYNLSIPSQLKAWIDWLASPGKTFRYTEHGPEGLCAGKRVIVASSRGGIYTLGSPAAAHEHQESYIAAFFSLLGISIEVIRAEGTKMGEVRDAGLKAAYASIAEMQV